MYIRPPTIYSIHISHISRFAEVLNLEAKVEYKLALHKPYPVESNLLVPDYLSKKLWGGSNAINE